MTPRVAVLRGDSVRPLVAPADETDLWLGLPCLDLTSTDAYDRFETPEPMWFGRLYQRSGVRRALRCRRCCLG